ncbi:helix-turn-helix domain-containing protein [Streptomyces sp. NPDC006739]|uniref:helix-turn-helix domain-containing protein n=1 Tax=Streptomyces sp. NPDC006739 TaxID=3364763 RepID=UPI0036894A2C
MPDELDPQVREFTSQLRRLVDRGGLSIAALADRTGYSKTSWERYLNGRLLAPKGAIVALAEVTGTHPVHLTTMWELAERAWSRSEMRHDMTMEAIRISQARAALGEFGGPPVGTNGTAGTAGRTGTARKSGGTVVTPGIAGPAGVSPTIPPQPTAPDADAREREGAKRGPGSTAGGNSLRPGSPSGWPSSQPPSPSPSSPSPSQSPSLSPSPSPSPTPSSPSPSGGPPGPGGDASAGRRRLTMFLAGVGSVLVVIAAVFFLTGGGAKKNESAAKSASPSATVGARLPAGVKCSGSGCTGKDAESMGCSGSLVTTTRTAAVGAATLEVRYSKTCGTAWGRITGAARGDQVQVLVGKVRKTGDITTTGDTIAYTPMVAVQDAAQARACARLASGVTGCTR